jgi:glycerophosphoryl diester phosphodiesterase
MRTGEAIRDALRAFARNWRRVVIVEICFKLLATVLLAAASSAVLAWVQSRTARSAVTNVDLVGFLARPQGVLVILLLAGAAAAFVLVEHGFLLALLARDAPSYPTLGARIAAGAAAVTRVARLAVFAIVLVIAVLAVAGGLLGATYAGLLAGHDINFYLSGKPPVFLAALAIGAVIGIAAAAVIVVFYLRWFLALPITIFEGLSPRKALSESRLRIRGAMIRAAAVFAVWHGTIAAISALVFLAFRPIAVRLVDAAGGSEAAVVATIVGLLVADALGTATMSFVSMVGQALIVLKIYEERRPPEVSGPERVPVSPRAVLVSAPAAVAIVAAGLIVASAVPAMLLVSRLGKQERIEVTAHRGASHDYPENTLAAIRGAIAAGSDWAEIDVQETADGHVIVLHDQDLMRLAGDPRKIAEMSFEDARKLDVGSRFNPRFVGERLPTLEEALDLAHGKIKLNVELKYYGQGDPRLAKDVARILHERGCERDCLVASLDYASLGDARKEWPALRTAAIVSAKVGDPTLLDADVLSMNGKVVDAAFVRSAHRKGKEILVWTIDDPKLATRFMEAGVDNLITNIPDPIGKLRDERAALPRAARLVLAFRVAVGAAIDAPAASAPIPEM